jgi:hypothetical protein
VKSTSSAHLSLPKNFAQEVLVITPSFRHRLWEKKR